MSHITKIAVGNFRGIKEPLTLEFIKNGRPTSVVLYGRNGTGKSSLVDAWEWFHIGKIAHLAREGAEERCYPHRACQDEAPFIEIDFRDESIGLVKIEYDCNRITRPRTQGNHTALKERIQYPCHLRYKDITDFVYKTKAEKYEYLAKYLGFEQSIQLENSLNTYQRRIEDSLTAYQAEVLECGSKIKTITGSDGIDVPAILQYVNSIAAMYDLQPIQSVAEIKNSVASLKEKVEKDSRTKQLEHYHQLKRTYSDLFPQKDTKDSLNTFIKKLSELQQDQAELSKIVLLKLLEAGLEILEKSESKDLCPLCDQPFDGNLTQYLEQKNNQLTALSKKRVELISLRRTLLDDLEHNFRKVETFTNNAERLSIPDCMADAVKQCGHFVPILNSIRKEFRKDIEDIMLTDEQVTELIRLNDISGGKTAIISELDSRINDLESDQYRKDLVSRYESVRDLENEHTKYAVAFLKSLKLTDILNHYIKIKNDFISDTRKNIQLAFDAISEDVERYFKALEKDNPYIAKPTLKLIEDRNRAIELEIQFVNESLSPLYKVLSESQLNSFGLSVFLAAVRRFNTDFKFMILDDVINSFDAYKRPQIIEVISDYFMDYQFLILTHDQIWFDNLQRRFPQWNRLRFHGWDYLTGPKVEPALNTYEEIEDLLTRDKPIHAGQILGRYLEWVLLQLCEKFEVPLKYRLTGQYTLAELFEPFKSRCLRKFTNKHKIYQKMESFSAKSSFRNFCAHWKEVESEFSSPEIKDIFMSWMNIEGDLKCLHCSCYAIPIQAGNRELLVCKCGKHDLKKDEWYCECAT